MSDPLARLTPEQRVLCLAARTSHAPDAAAEIRATVSFGVDWDRLWALGHLHEVIPLLADSLGDVAPGEWLARATRRRHVILRSNASLADALLPVLERMAASKIDAMPVKGLVLAEHLYGSLSARPSADIDVLVRREDLPAARQVLRDLGFGQSPSLSFVAAVHQFHDPAWTRGDGAEQVLIELHWALWAHSDERLGMAGLWQRAVSGTLLDQPIRMLSPEDMLLHLAIHRTRSALRLRWVVDVAELLRRHADTLDWDAYLGRARAAGARTSSWVILMLARDLLGAPVPTRVVDTLAVRGPKRALLEQTCGPTALFRAAADGDVTQQPHLVLRAFEEDGPRRITRSIATGVLRPMRQALHDSGVIRARRRIA